MRPRLGWTKNTSIVAPTATVNSGLALNFLCDLAIRYVETDQQHTSCSIITCCAQCNNVQEKGSHHKHCISTRAQCNNVQEKVGTINIAFQPYPT